MRGGEVEMTTWVRGRRPGLCVGIATCGGIGARPAVPGHLVSRRRRLAEIGQRPQHEADARSKLRIVSSASTPRTSSHAFRGMRSLCFKRRASASSVNWAASRLAMSCALSL